MVYLALCTKYRQVLLHVPRTWFLGNLWTNSSGTIIETEQQAALAQVAPLLSLESTDLGGTNGQKQTSTFVYRWVKRSVQT